jgi:hypothetical protein
MQGGAGKDKASFLVRGICFNAEGIRRVNYATQPPMATHPQNTMAFQRKPIRGSLSS